jgi:Ni/Fe-hydrogenase 1 B-type cytochrome subunit
MTKGKATGRRVAGIGGMKEVPRRIYYLFSPFLRIFHWVMVVAIVVLFVTGLLITKPMGGLSSEPTFTMLSMAMIRNIHFFAAFAFTAAFILRVYGFIVNKGDRLFPRVWEGQFWRATMDVSLHYALIQPSHKPYLRNPLARMSYVGLYAMVFIEMITGYAMYFMTDPSAVGGTLFGWANVVLGGEFITHLVHHYVAWFIILFAIGHIYMVIRADIMEGEGEASSMFSGIKILEHEPLDVGEIEDKKNS